MRFLKVEGGMERGGRLLVAEATDLAVGAARGAVMLVRGEPSFSVPMACTV